MDYANIPVIPPPPGVQSNFVDPPTLKTSLIAVNAIFLPLMLIAVTIRLYVRSHIVKTLGWDDLTCIIAALGSVVHSILMLYDIHVGYGTHLWDIRIIALTAADLQKIDALAILYPIIIFFVKLSIALLVIRLFGIHKRTRYLAYFGIVFCFLFYTAYMGTQIGTAVLCNSASSGSIALCANGDILTIISGVINVVTDFYLLALPIPAVMGLKLRRGQRAGLLVVFLAGFVACCVSFARLVFASVRLHSPDVVYNAALVTELTSVELNIGIITMSMSSMPQFFTKSRICKRSSYSSLGKLFSSRSRSRSNKSLESGESKASSEPSFEQNRPPPRGDNFIDTQDANQSHAFAGEKLNDSDDGSRDGILKTVNYNVSMAPEPGHFNHERDGEV
ncbi:MAG: hypothetical protein M1827_003116 [Pycnora praestabilis]|nr:MAG: hypothetical protein M1827_003116 [Pycnora praestabilis]